jgi:hypothetical protein
VAVPNTGHSGLRRSWLNAVEALFSALTHKRIPRSSFHSLVNLQAAINRYLADPNADPKTFIWTAPSTAILTKLRACSGCVSALVTESFILQDTTSSASRGRRR